MTAGGLIDAIASLAVTATGPFTPEELLQHLADVAAEHLDVDGVGVMIAEEDASRFVHSSRSDVAQVERMQELLQTGPCKSAILDRTEVIIDDLAACTNPEWAPYVAAALAGELRAAVALPLVSRGRSWGVLDLYRSRPQAWDERSLEVGRLLANVAVSYLVMAADRDDAQRAQDELAHRATHDALTGLPNRVLAFDRLTHALAAARRHGHVVAVLFIDLDGFKSVNDTFGHDAGDQVLIAAAERMSAAVRSSDTVARLAGDEFLVICEDLDGSDPAELRRELDTISTKLRTALEPPMPIGRRDVLVTASIGVAVADHEAGADDVIAASDSDMYAAKRRRRRQVSVVGSVADRDTSGEHA
jgi:diguanylate cyclase (GGDEF)-like protein